MALTVAIEGTGHIYNSPFGVFGGFLPECILDLFGAEHQSIELLKSDWLFLFSRPYDSHICNIDVPYSVTVASGTRECDAQRAGPGHGGRATASTFLHSHF